MNVHVRPVRFEEVDAASIVFFGHYLHFAHEAMEAFFSELEGGYSHLIVSRRVGLPAVDVHMSFVSPLAYGDIATIETSTLKIGNRSAVLKYRIRCADRRVAEIEHTVVTTDLDKRVSIEMPADVRAVLVKHLEV